MVIVKIVATECGLLDKRKEVKQYMKSIIKVLVVSALMVVLMATTVSPAFAGPYNHKGNGWGVDGYNGGCDDYNPKSEGWKWGKCTNIDYSN